MYRHYRIRYRRPGAGRGYALAATAGAVYLLAHHVGAGHVGHAGHAHVRTVADRRSESRAARVAITYAEHQLGLPYLWGGTGPAAFDCSGLFMEAWASAGVALERTSQQQWASEQHVSDPEPGDGVFFAGSDGTRRSPGHVGIVVNARRHLFIEAYGTGYPIRWASWIGRDPVGFTRPAGGRA